MASVTPRIIDLASVVPLHFQTISDNPPNKSYVIETKTVQFQPPDITTMQRDDYIIPDPFEYLQPENNTVNVNSSLEYRKLYISQAIIIPSIVLMVISSLLIIYVIIRHLRSIMKLYLSVIFYAVSILYFAAAVTCLLIRNKVINILMLIYRLSKLCYR